MSNARLLVFVDCNILIEGFLFPFHPACGAILLAANKRIDLVTCALVMEDIENVILEEAEKKDNYQMIEAWIQLLKQIRLRVMPDPPEDLVRDVYRQYLPLMRHVADIPVLASAIELGADLILSDNNEHFNDRVSDRCGIPIWSSIEFLENLAGGLVKEKLKKTK